MTPKRVSKRMARPSRSSTTSPRIEHRGEPRGGAAGHALGHRRDQHAAINVGEQALLGHRPPGRQRGGEIEPAEQAGVGDVQRQPAHRHLGRQQLAHVLQPAVAHRPGMGAQHDADQPDRIDREQRRGADGVHPRRDAGCGLGHAPNISVDGALDAHGRADLVQRVAAQAVAQRGGRDALELLVGDLVVAVERGQRAAGADQRQLAAQAVGAERHAQLRRPLQRGVGHLDLAKALAGGGELLAHLLVLLLPVGDVALRIVLEGIAPPHHLDAGLDVLRRLDLDREAEAVEQLRAQLALLRVAGADQDEARRVADRQALALDHVLAGGGDVEQEVDQVVLQEVDLVDIEEAAVGAGQQAGLERLLALGQRPLQVERADHAVLGGAERQVDHRHRHLLGLQRLAVRHPLAAGIAVIGLVRRVAAIGAADDGLHLGQQRRQRADGGGLAGAAIAEDKDAADRGVDSGDQEGELHLLLANDGGERKHDAHDHSVRRGRRAKGWAEPPAVWTSERHQSSPECTLLHHLGRDFPNQDGCNVFWCRAPHAEPASLALL